MLCYTISDRKEVDKSFILHDETTSTNHHFTLQMNLRHTLIVSSSGNNFFILLSLTLKRRISNVIYLNLVMVFVFIFSHNS